jgi:hypothetical protein
MNTETNHFELAVIIYKDGIAYDSGVCTWHDDISVEISYPEDAGFSIAYRYGDGREDDDLPPLSFVGAKAFQKAFPEVTITMDQTKHAK